MAHRLPQRPQEDPGVGLPGGGHLRADGQSRLGSHELNVVRRARVAAALLAAALPLAAPATASSATSTVPHFAGCQVFPSNNWWNRDVSRLPVHRYSATWLSHMSTGRDLHPDFGPSGSGAGYGMPVTVTHTGHPVVAPSFTYDDESDHVGYPLGADTRIEGGRDSGGDQHAVVVNADICRLYETFDTSESGGRWYAGSGATWSLRSNALRPDGWTSGDAAGLPIFAGLLRWGEVHAGRVGHAIRFTTDVTSKHHLWPARHDAGSTTSWAYPPMGARFRLRMGFRTTGYSYYARVVIAGMKRYGLVLADNGSPWFFQGEQNAAWPSGLVEELKTIPASAFEAVDTSSLMIDRDSAATR